MSQAKHGVDSNVEHRFSKNYTKYRVERVQQIRIFYGSSVQVFPLFGYSSEHTFFAPTSISVISRRQDSQEHARDNQPFLLVPRLIRCHFEPESTTTAETEYLRTEHCSSSRLRLFLHHFLRSPCRPTTVLGTRP